MARPINEAELYGPDKTHNNKGSIDGLFRNFHYLDFARPDPPGSSWRLLSMPAQYLLP